MDRPVIKPENMDQLYHLREHVEKDMKAVT